MDTVDWWIKKKKMSPYSTDVLKSNWLLLLDNLTKASKHQLNRGEKGGEIRTGWAKLTEEKEKQCNWGESQEENRNAEILFITFWVQSITSLVKSAQIDHPGCVYLCPNISLHQLLSRFHTSFSLGYTEYLHHNGKPIKKWCHVCTATRNRRLKATKWKWLLLLPKFLNYNPCQGL